MFKAAAADRSWAERRRGGLRPSLAGKAHMIKLDKTATAPLRGIGACLLIAVLTAGPIVPARADEAPLAGAPSAEAVTQFAMRWFAEMQAGRTDRSLYAPSFIAEVTDEAVATMSRDLNRYGAAPKLQRHYPSRRRRH